MTSSRRVDILFFEDIDAASLITGLAKHPRGVAQAMRSFTLSNLFGRAARGALMALALAATVGALMPYSVVPEAMAEETSARKVEFIMSRFDGRFHFALQYEDAILLRSPGYATKLAALEAIEEVQAQSRRVKNLPLRSLAEDQHYFIVEGAAGDVLATSPLYATSDEAREARARLKKAMVAHGK
jgi:uncharacterized protein YegP (UPF0339 family)